MHKPEQDMHECVTDYTTGKGAKCGNLAARRKRADSQQIEFHILLSVWNIERPLKILWTISILKLNSYFICTVYKTGKQIEWFCSTISFNFSVNNKHCNITYWSYHPYVYVYIFIYVYVCMHAKSLQSCPTLCDLMDCSPPGSSVHDILQARILEWVATPTSRRSSHSGIELVSYVPRIVRQLLYH